MTGKPVDNETAGYLDVIHNSCLNYPKLPVCNRCRSTWGLHLVAPSVWICPACIRKELDAVRAELEQYKQAYGDCLGLRNDSQRLVNTKAKDTQDAN